MGCWSGSFALYAILSTLGWIVTLFVRNLGRGVGVLYYVFNLAAFVWLMITTFLVLTGGLDTCWCRTSALAKPFGGYMTFADTEAVRETFSVVKYWAIAAGVGLAIPVTVFVVTIFWWLKCAHLWKANEDRDTENILLDSKINWKWLT